MKSLFSLAALFLLTGTSFAQTAEEKLAAAEYNYNLLAIQLRTMFM